MEDETVVREVLRYVREVCEAAAEDEGFVGVEQRAAVDHVLEVLFDGVQPTPQEVERKRRSVNRKLVTLVTEPGLLSRKTALDTALETPGMDEFEFDVDTPEEERYLLSLPTTQDDI